MDDQYTYNEYDNITYDHILNTIWNNYNINSIADNITRQDIFENYELEEKELFLSTYFATMIIFAIVFFAFF
jgi:hypothetical protein